MLSTGLSEQRQLILAQQQLIEIRISELLESIAMFSSKAQFLENMHQQDWLFEDPIRSSEASATSTLSSPSHSKTTGANCPINTSKQNNNNNNNNNTSPHVYDGEVGDQFERKAQERRKEALANFLLNYDNDLYFILGLPHAASKHDIRQQFKRLSLIHHPDKQPARPSKEEDTNNSKDQNQFSAISNAYKILSNDNLREIYDAEGYQAVQIAMRAEAQE